MDVNSLSDTEFNQLVTKASRMQQRRQQLLAQIQASEQQIAELERKAKSQFGEDYLIKFSDSITQIQAWEEAN